MWPSLALCTPHLQQVSKQANDALTPAAVRNEAAYERKQRSRRPGNQTRTTRIIRDIGGRSTSEFRYRLKW